MNNSLVQLLTLYRIEAENFTLNIDEYSASEILNDIKAQQSSLFDLSNIVLEIKCNEDLLSAILNLGFSDKINPIPYPKKIL
ncbi:hypothetical protein BPUTEOMOX_2648 [methanotrophic endosymbiont of Bathymodiolus puteoserpentis (Logatchev)]|nr:hypothetical protein BPUTEOMOX_2648 [methanotrophic endosymbiont of Bathymodiolus puteoserpentis (Logatchev)]